MKQSSRLVFSTVLTAMVGMVPWQVGEASNSWDLGHVRIADSARSGTCGTATCTVWDQRIARSLAEESRDNSEFRAAQNRSGAEPQTQCTPLPALYENWRRTVIKEDLNKPFDAVSDQEFDKYVQSQRAARLPGLRTVFYEIAHMTGVQRAAKGERVLWEDQEIMVLVDNRARAPKALVIPKIEGIWLLTDAPEALRKRLAQIAAITSDAFMDAQKEPCQQGAVSEIFIHPPGKLGVQQLHVHVKPGWSLRASDTANDFYRRVSERLAEKLAGRQDSG